MLFVLMCATKEFFNRLVLFCCCFVHDGFCHVLCRFGTSLVMLLLTVIHLFEVCCCCCCSLLGWRWWWWWWWWWVSQFVLLAFFTRVVALLYWLFLRLCWMHVSCVIPAASMVCFHFDAHLAIIMLMTLWWVVFVDLFFVVTVVEVMAVVCHILSRLLAATPVQGMAVAISFWFLRAGLETRAQGLTWEAHYLHPETFQEVLRTPLEPLN